MIWGSWWTYALVGFACFAFGAFAGIDMVMRIHHWYTRLHEKATGAPRKPWTDIKP